MTTSSSFSASNRRAATTRTRRRHPVGRSAATTRTRHRHPAGRVPRAKRLGRRRQGLPLAKPLKCRTSPAVSGSGGVDREVNSPARAEGGASPAPGNSIKKASRGYSKAGIRPSGRTGELTGEVNSASALRGKIFNFAYVALSLRADSLRRLGCFAPAPRPAGCRCRVRVVAAREPAAPHSFVSLMISGIFSAFLLENPAGGCIVS